MIKFLGDKGRGEEVDDEHVPKEFRTPHLCPTCGGKPRPTNTRYGVRFSCCRNWAWGPHPLVDRETHEARKRAHEVFDELWRKGQARGYRPGSNRLRGIAYARLAEILKLHPEKCHIKQMDAETAKMVLVAVPRIKAEWRAEGWWVDN